MFPITFETTALTSAFLNLANAMTYEGDGGNAKFELRNSSSTVLSTVNVSVSDFTNNTGSLEYVGDEVIFTLPSGTTDATQIVLVGNFDVEGVADVAKWFLSTTGDYSGNFPSGGAVGFSQYKLSVTTGGF